MSMSGRSAEEDAEIKETDENTDDEDAEAIMVLGRMGIRFFLDRNS